MNEHGPAIAPEASGIQQGSSEIQRGLQELDVVPPVPNQLGETIDSGQHHDQAVSSADVARTAIARSAEPDVVIPAEATWMHEPEAEREAWRVEQHKDLRNWAENQRLSGTEWAAEQSAGPKDIIEAAAGGDKDALVALSKYVAKADSAELLEPEFEQLWQTDSFRYWVYRKIGEMRVQAMREKVKFNDQQRELVGSAFKYFGFNENEWPSITQSWLSFRIEKDDPATHTLGTEIDEGKVKKLKQTIFQNFHGMEQIEHERPGAVKALHNRDGIRNFERYHPDQLLDQLLHPWRRPERVALSGAESWNTFSSRGQLYAALAKLTHWSRKKHIVFLEADTADEAHDRLKAVSDRTGPIEKLFIGSHMDKYNIALGKGAVTSDDIYGRNGKQPFLSDGILAPGAEIIMYGCEAGTEDGIAFAMSDATGARTKASPDLVTGIEKKRFKEATFAGVKTVTYGPSRAVSAMRRAVGRLRQPKP